MPSTTRAAALILCIAAPAAGQDSVSLSGTKITLQPGERAEFEVEFSNRNVNGARHDGWQSLEIEGMAVDVRFRWDALLREASSTYEMTSDADRLDVVPPAGWVCVPASCRIDVEENQTGIIELHRAAVGM